MAHPPSIGSASHIKHQTLIGSLWGSIARGSVYYLTALTVKSNSHLLVSTLHSVVSHVLTVLGGVKGFLSYDISNHGSEL